MDWFSDQQDIYLTSNSYPFYLELFLVGHTPLTVLFLPLDEGTLALKALITMVISVSLALWTSALGVHHRYFLVSPSMVEGFLLSGFVVSAPVRFASLCHWHQSIIPQWCHWTSETLKNSKSITYWCHWQRWIIPIRCQGLRRSIEFIK